MPVLQESVVEELLPTRYDLTLSDVTFRDLRDFVYQKTGIFFQDKKKYLLEGRLGKRVQMLNLDGFESYLHFLKYGQEREGEMQFLHDAVTINETFFFRNPPQLNALETSLIPRIVDTRKNGWAPRIRIWSAACSSGEEPYSLAILFLEKLKPAYPGLSMEIIGTDISPSALTKARRGIYSEYSVRNTPEEYLEKYFVREDDKYQLVDEVKKVVMFHHLNLFNRNEVQTMKTFDFILCCNVLIYFDLKSKIQVIGDLYNSLAHGGHLFVGYAEVLHGISSAFKVVNFPKTIAYRKE